MGSLCGITAGGPANEIATMLRALEHRHGGRASEAFEAPGGGAYAGFSGRTAPQPWTHGQWAMVGDIDIFDIGRLLEALSAAGHRAPDASREDIVLFGWAALGPSAFAHVNGDYAIAIVDLDSGVTHLARDRSGARPVYYARVDDAWAFASEYKAILALGDIDRSIDRGAMQMLHQRKVVPADRTLLSAIQQVPAHSIVSLAATGAAEPERFWQAPGDIAHEDFTWHRDRIATRFQTAVERRLSARDRIGISVSGGVDSIAMVAAARKAHPDATIQTYTIGDRPDDPEITVAQRVADHYGSEHQFVVFSNDNLAARMRQLVWGLEDPIARTESLMTQDLCALAHADVDVMLRGDGADGLFGGMARHKILALAQRLPIVSRQLIDVYEFTQSGAIPKNLLSRALIKGYFRSSIPPPPAVIDAPAAAAPLVPDYDSRELLNRILWKGPQHALPMLLQKVERPHAQRGMRTVSPFLDIDLVDAAMAVPSLGKNNGRRNKIVFREAAATLLPEEFARVPKFAQRVKETPAFCAALSAIVESDDVVTGLASRGIFAAAEMQALTALPAEAAWPPEHAMRVWTLILTEYWFRYFVDGQTPPAIAP